MMNRPFLPPLLSRRVPVFYGWIVLACLCCAGFARQGPAVATLSIFVEPLTREFGWSRTALSGAVSLGGVLAAVAAPLELGLYGALNNWFVRRRTFASSVATLAQQAGLVAMPLIAQLAILREG